MTLQTSLHNRAEERTKLTANTVMREGEVGAGDEIKVMAREPNAVAVSEFTHLYVVKRLGEAEIPRGAAGVASGRIAGELEGILQGAAAAGREIANRGWPPARGGQDGNAD